MSYEDLAVGTSVEETATGNTLVVEKIEDDGTVLWDDGISETPKSIRSKFESGDYFL